MQTALIEPFFAALQAANPHPQTELEYTTVFELLAAVLLSAQATDVGVNKATRKLFPVANTPQAILDLGLDGLEAYIKTIGLYKSKARHLMQTCRILVEQHGGVVPRTREALEALPGVGRKTANVVLNVAFGEATFAVDTHVFRVCNRSGLAPGRTPLEVETGLQARVPERYRADAHHWLILHGRYVCMARRPLCESCSVAACCDHARDAAGLGCAHRVIVALAGAVSIGRWGFLEVPLTSSQRQEFVRRIYGSKEFTNGLSRYCLWIEDKSLAEARRVPDIAHRIAAVEEMRLSSTDAGGRAMAKRSHQLREMRSAVTHALVMPRTSSESRQYLPAGLIATDSTVSSEAFGVFDAPLWQLAILISRLHLAWIATICGQLKTDYRYSNELGWNTFPVPLLTEQNKADLTGCAEDILLAREAHFPATIADLYDPETMPDNLRHAHERNDEVLERIYIGRRFKNDTERLEKLFELYTKMSAAEKGKPAAKATRGRKKAV